MKCTISHFDFIVFFWPSHIWFSLLECGALPQRRPLSCIFHKWISASLRVCSLCTSHDARVPTCNPHPSAFSSQGLLFIGQPQSTWLCILPASPLKWTLLSHILKCPICVRFPFPWAVLVQTAPKVDGYYDHLLMRKRRPVLAQVWLLENHGWTQHVSTLWHLCQAWRR